MTLPHISFSIRGGTGNNICQYCTARLFAEQHALDFPELPISLWPFTVSNHTPYRPSCTLLTDADAIMDLSVHDGVDYHFNGWFQRAAWFMPHRQTIQQWFAHLLPVTPRYNDNEIVMHLRLCNYRSAFSVGNRVIHPQWYSNILATTSFTKLHIVAQELDRQYLSTFACYHPVLIHGNDARNDFDYLRQFSRMLMSNSTFAWWSWFFGHGTTAWTFKPWVRGFDEVQLAHWPGSFIEVDGVYETEHILDTPHDTH